jgi:hypothetical protein
VGPEDIITQDVMVNFNVDVRPAFYKMMAGYYIIDVQTGDTLESIDEVDVAGFFNGWPWGSFAPDYIAHDDGVGPDSVAGDTVYAADIQFYAGDPIVLEYKYGLNGYDVEAGFAENHFVNIDDSSPIFVIWPPDIFGSQGDLYDPWIYVREIPRPYMPENFTLHQNYPNPFNPVTQIMFDLPVAGKVTLKVFNVKGEEVYRTTTARLDPGFYSFKFDGTNLASGVYIYQVTTEGFAASKKMMLLK